MAIKVDLDNSISFGGPEWLQQMAALGKQLHQHQVRRVLFIHGTFAGDDPLGFFHILKSFNVSDELVKRWKQRSKNRLDQTVNDLGNFPDDYVAAFAEAISETSIHCDKFVWSGENNHFGRLRELGPLVKHIASAAKHERSGTAPRLLLIGHSHAGQLFALLTLLLERQQPGEALLSVLRKYQVFDYAGFESDLDAINMVALDFVTLGTPVRYAWADEGNYRLVSLVNHRSPVRFNGLLYTRDGDYVQHWATEGTDFLSAVAVNDELDEILDQGRAWNIGNKLKQSQRREPKTYQHQLAGMTLHIDYQDQSTAGVQLGGWRFFGKPNCVESLFGHGAYTLKENMLFTTQLIVDNFYS